jgi:hypothetical protein
MAKMFRDRVDQNNVEISTNDHSAESYSHPLSEQRPARSRYVSGEDGRGGYTEAPTESIVAKTRDRVIGGEGSRPGAMSFSGDLLPRCERVPREMAGRAVEHHDANCWCDLCHPPMGMTSPGVTYLK